MFNLNDISGIALFKERLAKTRKEKGFTQEQFAKKLHTGERSRISNWENSNNSRLLHLSDFSLVCKILDVDPNYLLGVSDDQCTNDKEIADTLHISTDSVKILREEPYIGTLIDYFLSADKFNSLLLKIRHACVNGYYYVGTLEEIFSSNALSKIQKAFNHLFEEISYLDMTPELFAAYLSSEFHWNQKKYDFFKFLDSLIIEPKYHEMLANDVTFMELSNDDKFDVLMHDIANSSYEHLLSNATTELSIQSISNIVNQILSNFIEDDISKFKANLNKTT